MAPRTGVNTIIVKTDDRASKDLAKIAGRVGKVTKEVRTASVNFNRLSNTIRAAAAAFGTREIARAADSYQLLNDRLKVIVGSQEAAAATFEKVKAAADFTKASIDVFGDGFNKIAISAKSAGLSIDDTVKVTTALQQTLRLSGATAQEAESTFLQFSQALSLGRVQGQELRAILLSNAKFSQLLADELGVTRGELKKLGEEGKITADVALQALLKNLQRLNDEAGNLQQTFGQTVILAFNQINTEIGKLSQQLGLNSAFAKGVQIFVDNFGKIAKVLTGLVSAGIVLKLARSFAALSASIRAVGVALATVNPYVLAFQVAAAGIAAILPGIAFEEFVKSLEEDKLSGTEKALKGINEELAEVQRKLKARQSLFDSLQGTVNPERNRGYREYLKLQKEEADLKTQLEAIEIRLAKEQKKNDPSKQARRFKLAEESLKKLNTAYLNNGLTLDQYNERLEKLKLDQAIQKFREGKISVEQFNMELAKLGDNALDDGQKLSLGIETATTNIQNSVGNLATQISGGIQNTFGKLEDELLNFVKTGKFNFKDFSQFILDEINKIIIRLSIIKPLADGIGSFVGGDSSTGTTTLKKSANGNVFSGGNIKAFANGGVLTGPAIFPLRGGQTGLAGEAGPEAIMPLTRGANGRLGVDVNGKSSPVIVNVINNADASVDVQQSAGPNGEKQLEVIINAKVNEGISSGRFDKSLGATFGLSRRGM